MTLCHVKRIKDPFVRLHKNIVMDPRISWKAKGILSYAFSRPDDWSFYKSEMIKHAKDGKDSIESGIKELEDIGYLHRKKTRDVKTGQLTGWEWYFFENPITEEEFKKLFRNTENPDIGKTPMSGKSAPTKNDSYTKKETTTITTPPSDPPTKKKEVVVVFPCLEKIQISQELKEELSSTNSEADLEKAVSRCLAWKGRLNDEVGIRTALKKGDTWTDIQSQEDIEAINIPFLNSLAKYDGTSIGPIAITVGYKYIEFSGNMKTETFTIDQRDFIEGVNAYFAKLRKNFCN